MSVSLDALAREASPDAVALAVAVLEGDFADRVWREQVGASLSQRDTARLLGRSEQAVSKDRRLLRVSRRDGRPVYPVFQFEGRRQRPGVADVVSVLEDSVNALTTASWLTAPNDTLGGSRPIDALTEGRLEEVLSLAARMAERMKH